MDLYFWARKGCIPWETQMVFYHHTLLKLDKRIYLVLLFLSLTHFISSKIDSSKNFIQASFSLKHGEDSAEFVHCTWLIFIMFNLVMTSDHTFYFTFIYITSHYATCKIFVCKLELQQIMQGKWKRNLNLNNGGVATPEVRCDTSRQCKNRILFAFQLWNIASKLVRKKGLSNTGWEGTLHKTVCCSLVQSV